jgi:hypothetical protein
MNKVKWIIISLVAVALFAVMVVQAKSDKQVQSKQIVPKTASEITIAPDNSSPQPVSADSKQGYQLKTDVLDSFGGELESDNYIIPVSSGGEPSGIGISVSTTYGIEAGFVLASKIKRGDVSANGTVDMGDAIYILNYLFKGGTDPCPMETGDVNCTGLVDLGDAIFLLNYLFKGGVAPSC